MNVWQFLGLPKDHRPIGKVVQLVKHYDEVPDSRKSFPLIGQVKRDGVFAMQVSYQGRHAIFGRTGLQLTNVSHVIRDHLPDGVYIAELTCNLMSLEQLSGCVNPNRVGRLSEDIACKAKNFKMGYHDCLSLRAFIDGKWDLPYTERYLEACSQVGRMNVLPYSIIQNEEQLQAFADKCIADGEEGAVFKRDVGWEAGHKGWRSMKIVRGVSYDLECIGYEEGTGKYAGKVANLLFRWKDGKTIKAMLGKGWSHSDAERMFRAINAKVTPTLNDPGFREWMLPIGKVFKVVALQESSKGVLRLPKVREERHDKATPDY
ncbi:ATP-dependent DNA ligase [Aeromonas phage vB_AspA_Tola]|nr:ATP-dependent DNA ligase [Aeromonas phage vB_AspA_Tola]